jgi:hypothetical protein
MPFQEDTGPREEKRGHVWASFATVGSQVELFSRFSMRPLWQYLRS